MRTYFVPNARFVVLLALLLAVLSVSVLPVLAQDETPPVTVVVEQPDVQPALDRLYDGLDEFMQNNETQIVMGLIAFAVIALLRIILPDTQLDTERIMQLVVGLFTLLYMASIIFDFQAGLFRGIEIGSVIGNSIGTLLMILGVSGTTYAVLGRALQVPLVARPQGSEWGRLGNEPELVLGVLEERVADPVPVVINKAADPAVARHVAKSYDPDEDGKLG